MQKPTGSPNSQPHSFNKIASSIPNKQGVNSNGSLGHDKARSILGEHHIDTNSILANGKGVVHPFERKIENTAERLHHEYRIDTQNTNYDLSDGESIHEIDASGIRHRKKPNLMIKLEERRTTIGSNFA